MGQHYTARKKSVPNRVFSLEIPVRLSQEETILTQACSISESSPYTDIGTNNRLQKETVMLMEADKII